MRMSKKVLVIYYSQSGQLGEILDQLTLPLSGAGHQVEKVRIYPLVPYPFPWTGKSFFSVMPDCVLEVPAPLQPFTIKESRYDLIIVGYQAWFLSPSIPSNSFLQHEKIKSALINTPVITVTGARNMWISAMEVVKKRLRESGARLAGNIALTDRHPNLISFITIFQWMFKGRKERYLGIFPKPGVADEDIACCSRFGETVQEHLATGKWEGLQEELIRQKAIEVKYRLMFIESKAKRIFRIWASFIAGRKNKTAWLVVFKYYLILALFLAAPVILTLDAIFFKPFLSSRIKKQMKYYSGID